MLEGFPKPRSIPFIYSKTFSSIKKFTNHFLTEANLHSKSSLYGENLRERFHFTVSIVIFWQYYVVFLKLVMH